MKLATFREADGSTRVGRVENDRAILLEDADLGALLGRPGWHARGAAAGGMSVPLDGLVAAPPVLAPRKILCVGLNYAEHIREMGRELPEYPTLFTKFADTLLGARDELVLPAASTKVDWEAELAVVVGAPLRRGDEEEARRAIAGYTVANDVSMRDWQYRTTQWQQGKMFDSSTPIGPVLVTADEFDPSDGARITTRVNGEIVQDDSVDDLVFTAPAMLSYISGFCALAPGDIVLTGTPGGVGAGRRPERYLAAGDLLETEIEGIGLLSTRVVAEDHRTPR